jgi:hypothetical protein
MFLAMTDAAFQGNRIWNGLRSSSDISGLLRYARNEYKSVIASAAKQSSPAIQ